MFGCKSFVPDNYKKYKIKHTPRINILVVLKYRANKILLRINYIFRWYYFITFNWYVLVENDETISLKHTLTLNDSFFVSYCKIIKMLIFGVCFISFFYVSFSRFFHMFAIHFFSRQYANKSNMTQTSKFQVSR